MKHLTIFLVALPLMGQIRETGSVSAFRSVTATPLTAGASAVEPALSLVERPAAPPSRSLYRWSLALLAISSAADVASSWHGNEANPVLGGQRSTFGVGSAAIKLGLVGSCFLLEHLTLRHRPELHRKVAWLNFGLAGAQTVVVEHNLSVR